MIYTTFILLIGLTFLILGGEFLVRGASSLALRVHISPLVVGLTIVAFGTSAPELLISLKSALSGNPDIAVGNVIGSNICNLALVLGVTAVISPISISSNSIKIDWPVTMGSAVLLYLLVQDESISRIEGIVFVVLLALYSVFIIRKSRKENKATIDLEGELDLTQPTGFILKDLAFVVLGSLGLFFGADWFVEGAATLADFLGVTQRVIGITVVALGTSLPELVTSALASFRKQSDLAVGNLMGSNIFNIFSILGITSIVQNIAVNKLMIEVDFVWMLGVTFLILPLMFFGKKITRFEGLLLLSVYCVYTYLVIT